MLKSNIPTHTRSDTHELTVTATVSLLLLPATPTAPRELFSLTREERAEASGEPEPAPALLPRPPAPTAGEPRPEAGERRGECGVMGELMTPRREYRDERICAASRRRCNCDQRG